METKTYFIEGKCSQSNRSDKLHKKAHGSEVSLAAIFLDHGLLLPVVAQDRLDEAGTFGPNWRDRSVLLLLVSAIVFGILRALGVLHPAQVFSSTCHSFSAIIWTSYNY